MVFIYNCRESVPVKIDSLAFLGEGKENWTIFSWPHCGIFKTSNEKAPHKLEVKIAKTPFISHTSLKGKEQLAFPPSCAALVVGRWSKRETPRRDFRLAPFDAASLLLQCGFPGASQPPGMSQKGQQCGCGSPHRA